MSQAGTTLAREMTSGKWGASFSLPFVAGVVMLLFRQTISDSGSSRTKVSRSTDSITSKVKHKLVSLRDNKIIIKERTYSFQARRI